MVYADGVFHHIDTEDFHRFLSAFLRVLKPGGHVAVNFVSLLAPEGYARFRAHADSCDQRDVFRWHHPEVVRLLCEKLGFIEIELTRERVKAGDFVWYLTCRKPSQ
jgi:SAM-dependent methyltransferase